MPRPADGLNGKAPAKSLASPRYRIGLQLSSGVPNRCAERVALANVPVAADGRLAVMLRKPTLAFYARDDRHGACGPRRPHPIPARSIRGRGGQIEKCPTESKNVQLKGTSLDPGQGEPQRLQLLGGALLPTPSTPCRRRTGRHSSGTVGREVALPHAVANGQRKLKPVPTLGSRARESACRIPILHQPPQHLTVLVSRARARSVAISFFPGWIHPPPLFVERGGRARAAGVVGADFVGSGTVAAQWAAICRCHWELQLDSGLPNRCAVGNTQTFSILPIASRRRRYPLGVRDLSLGYSDR